MYFLISCAILALLVWLRVLTVHDAWLLGIPAFGLFYCGTFIVRWIGYAIANDDREKHLASIMERCNQLLRQKYEIQEELRQQSETTETVGRFAAGVVGGLTTAMGHPLLGPVAEGITGWLAQKATESFLSPENERLKHLDLQYQSQLKIGSKLQQELDHARFLRNGFIIAMFLTTVVVWVAIYFGIV